VRDDRDVTVIETGSGSGVRWFLLGAAIGAGLGLLFAPQSGERTRNEIAQRGRKLRQRAQSTLEDLSDEVHVRGRKIKERAAEFVDDVLEEVQEGKRTVEQNASTAREEMERRLADARARARAAVGADVDAEDDDERE